LPFGARVRVFGADGFFLGGAFAEDNFLGFMVERCGQLG
jgi:hypothetical protein